MEDVDVLIVGAGLSGICAAYYMQTRCPGKTYAILEGREAMGGTWDLFRYPGVRSDSDMHTLGYRFRPWRGQKAIADGPSIREYIRETAAEYGIDQKIHFGHRVCRASWSSADRRWTVEAERTATGEKIELTCAFLYMCTGYYDYAQGYTPAWPGVERFSGRIVHPQQWPPDLDYANQRVVVIGSGATAITLVPAMADKAAHVTMLQRSPTYVISMPSRDRGAAWLARRLPAGLAYRLARARSILLGQTFYNLSRRFPGAIRRLILKGVRAELGPEYDVDKHFAPRYNPWDQRLCVAADGDLFTAIKSGKASVVTDEIEEFSETGIRLRSGQELKANLVVTATGLVMKLMSGVQLAVDGRPIALSDTISYKGFMYSGIPNLASAFGYTNASWTLKCELIAEYVCRLLNYMDRHGYRQCTPRLKDPNIKPERILDFTSGYVERALDSLPRQGSRRPWKLYQNYVLDLLSFRFGRIDDGAIEFEPRDSGSNAKRVAA